MKRALVCGAGGFIGGHLVKKLKREGYWVRGVDIKEHEFAPTQADEFLLLDLRDPENCRAALTLRQPFDKAQDKAQDRPFGGAQDRLCSGQAPLGVEDRVAERRQVPPICAEERRGRGAGEMTCV
jgi:nucleoside-diphosphate-sugar epimerase